MGANISGRCGLLAAGRGGPELETNRRPPLTGRRIAITGGGGFIGAGVVARLHAEGARLQLLGPPPLKRAAVRQLVDGSQVGFDPVALAGSVEELRMALVGCDSLIHLGYQRPASEGFWGQLSGELDLNLKETARLLTAAQASGVNFVCFASSTAVYGPSPQAVREDAPAAGETPYAVVKLMQEDCVLQWSRLTGHPAAILRMTAVYGPGETAHRAVPNFIRAVLVGRRPVLDGDGSAPFDLIYVDDVARAFTLATARRTGGTFNIATGIPITAREIAERIIGLCGVDLSCREEAGRPARVGAICDVSAAAAELGFRALTPLDTGLREAIAWLRSVQEEPDRILKPLRVDSADRPEAGGRSA